MQMHPYAEVACLSIYVRIREGHFIFTHKCILEQNVNLVKLQNVICVQLCFYGSINQSHGEKHRAK